MLASPIHFVVKVSVAAAASFSQVGLRKYCFCCFWHLCTNHNILDTSSSQARVESTHAGVLTPSGIEVGLLPCSVKFECIDYTITCRPNPDRLDSNTNMILIACCLLQSHCRLGGSCGKLSAPWLHMRND